MNIKYTKRNHFELNKIRIAIVLFLLVRTISIGYAQPIVTSDWFYKHGDTVRLAYFYPPSPLNFEEGADVIWDFSNAPAPKDTFDRIWYKAEDLPFHEDFPDANVGYLYSSDNANFYSTSENNMRYLGNKSTSFIENIEEGEQVECINNFAFVDIIISDYISKVKKLNGSYEYNDTILDSITYAGFGTVITPEGVFDNCIMTKLIRRISGEIHRLEIFFHKDKLSNVVARYRHLPINTEPPITMYYGIDVFNTSSTYNTEIKNQFELVHSQNLTYLKSNHQFNGRIQIIGINGQLVDDQSYNLAIGLNLLDTQKIQAQHGIFHIIVTDIDYGVFRTFKIIK